MIDSGATSLFVSKRFVRKHNVFKHPLGRNIPLYNIDGSHNRAGGITHFVRLQVVMGDYAEWREFLVTDLGPEDIVLGLPWLRSVNPEIDWMGGGMRVETVEESEEAGRTTSKSGARRPKVTVEDCEEDEEDESSQERREGDEKEQPMGAEDGEAGVKEEEEESTAERVRANRAQRRKWWKAGVLEEATEELWCAAGYTYSTELAEKANKEKRQRTFEEIVPEEYRAYAKVFSEGESERLPEHKPCDHAIDLKPDAPETIRSKVYPMPVNEQEELDRFLDENLRKGYIVPSKSPIASPVFFVKKKDGKLRLVQDYRKLNDVTVKNRYPLPLASDIINRLRQAKYFTKFDVRWGYHNVRIKEGDEWKAAFTTNRGLFEPRVMLFGLTNSPATFQALMNSIFADLFTNTLEEHRKVTHEVLKRLQEHDLYLCRPVAVYLDDILIFTNTLEEHRKVTHEVLKRLQEHDLYLRPEKCEFERTEIEYLGLIIRQGEVGMDPVKVKAVASWPTPKNLRDVRGFLGFANFYRRFIQDFAKRARPLNDLTKKDAPWMWGTSQRLAFESLKEAFIREPILTTWAPDRPTRIEVDASGFATGGVLLQKLEDGAWHPVAYRSQSMAEAERNYEIYDREMLGIIRALEDWQHYLEGLPATFDIITDHRNLEYWQTAKNLSRRQARWSLYLSRFNFQLAHKPGTRNMQADPLSRLSTYQITDADDNHDQIILGPERFATLAATSMEHSEREMDTLEQEIREATEREPEVVHVLPTTTDITAAGVADIHYREIFRLHGIPTKVVSDRGPQFAACFMHALYTKLGITRALTTAYHPQSNGQTERANQEVEKHLRLFTNARHDDWVKYLPTAEFVLNSRVHAAHGMAPFEILYGYRPDFTIPMGPPTKFPALNERLRNLRDVRKEADAALRMEKAHMKHIFETGKPQPHVFKPGDKVWLSSKDIPLTSGTRKLAPRQLGPYDILERTGNLTYRLQLPISMKQRHPVVHVDRLSPWRGNEINGEEPPPPAPVEIDHTLENEVEAILDSRKYNNQFQYLIKWRGEDHGQDSWEPIGNVTHCDELIADFHRLHPNAPRRISASIFATLPWQEITNFTAIRDDGP
uniref:RNA-directed DNA polymerase n=1 Tax=Ganoderma boninense TaxID=34458 RepID=A0A5K1JYZ7_9APHY|nr:BZIP domain-containing protein [Ganoderma boninense]